MKVIIGGRGSGKTVEAVKHSAESGRKIVVMSKQQEKLILETAEYLGIKDLPKPIVLSENNIGYVGHRDEVILENANVFLREIFGLNVVAITINSDETTYLE